MRSRHKTQNIDMKAVIMLMTSVNILAFFNVVASSQISPHFSGCKDIQNLLLANILIKNFHAIQINFFLDVPEVVKEGKKCI